MQPDDVVYAHKASSERRFWSMASFGGSIVGAGPVSARLTNAAYTGDAERSWLDDLLARGPFRDAAVLGCDETRYDAQWLQRGGSPRLDVYEFSPAVARRVRAQLGPLRRRVRFVRADLNFAALPAERYDVIWSSGCLHHIVNLEHLYAQIARALRPGGLFALHDYVGERRMQYRAARLERLNALLREVPPRFRHGGVAAITPRAERDLSPLCAVRSDDVLPLAEARFAVVHKGLTGGLFPLLLHLDLDALARDDPAHLARLVAAEEARAARSRVAAVHRLRRVPQTRVNPPRPIRPRPARQRLQVARATAHPDASRPRPRAGRSGRGEGGALECGSSLPLWGGPGGGVRPRPHPPQSGGKPPHSKASPSVTAIPGRRVVYCRTGWKA